MTRTEFTFLLVPIVCAASCARASARPVADGIPDLRVIAIGHDVSVRSGPRLTALPPDQRYRFVPPESLAMGLAADVSAIWEPELAEWRRAFSTVIANGQWIESADSARFDVAIFTTARTKMRREGRPQLATNVTTCGQPSTQLQLCTDDPFLHTEQWDTEYLTFHVLRRRSDGAMRVWRHWGTPAASNRSAVAADLRDMLRMGARDVDVVHRPRRPRE